jgi:hypothetical protein
MKVLRTAWQMMQALWLLYMLCYKMASLAHVKAMGAHQRIDGLVSAVAPAVSLQANGGAVNGTTQINGDLHISGTIYGSSGVVTMGDQLRLQGTLISPNQTPPAAADPYVATMTSLAQMEAFWDTAGSGGAIMNEYANRINSIITQLQASGIF